MQPRAARPADENTSLLYEILHVMSGPRHAVLRMPVGTGRDRADPTPRG